MSSHKTGRTTAHDIESLNQSILRIDLDDLDVEVLDQRIELTLASWFGASEHGGRPGCGQFTCAGYWPD